MYRYNTMIDFMTAIYIHPCYLNNMISNELLSDNECYDILTEIYESKWNFKIEYLISYTLTALKRDIVRGGVFESLDLKKLPSQAIIDEEKKNKARILKRRKIQRRKNKKLGIKDKIEEDDSLSDDEINENRPDCLFYRLLKFILKTDPGVKSFIHLVSIYMINKIFLDKTFSEPDGGNYNAK